jgi:cytochrome c oxidase cbb3-type subunit 3
MFIFSALLPMASQVFGQTAAATPAPAETTYPAALAYVLLAATAVLMLVIFFLGKVVVLAVKAKAEKQQTHGAKIATTIILAFLVFQNAFGANVPAPVEPPVQSVVSAYIIYLLGSVILLELGVIFAFTQMIFRFLTPEKSEAGVEKTKSAWRWTSFLYKKNTEAEIAQLDLGHNYDGIKELDNDIPAWWKWAFYSSMAFAVVYLFVYHVGKFAPLQQQELKQALANAEKAKAILLKEKANSLDENSVTMLSGADLEAGKALFTKPGACSTCHGKDASGTVEGNPGIGPNLTDKYWLHKGSIKDIFYSIKYGWPEKGMKPWKDDFSPKEIAQLASYIKSLQGSSPANPKEKQGELWEETEGSQSTSPVDSVKLK